MTTIGERIKHIRTYLQLTQVDFGKQIALSQGHLTAMEHNKRDVTDRTIKLIVQEFHINESWLRTGEGDMMAASADNIFDEFAQHYALTPEEKATARFLLRLSKDERAAILHYLKTWAAEITAAEQ